MLCVLLFVRNDAPPSVAAIAGIAVTGSALSETSRLLSCWRDAFAGSALAAEILTFSLSTPPISEIGTATSGRGRCHVHRGGWLRAK